MSARHMRVPSGGESARRTIARQMRQWLHQPRPAWDVLYPLMPSFSAQTQFAVRGTLAMAAACAFLLHPATNTLLRGAVLLPVSAVTCLSLTLGGTLLTAWRVSAAAMVGVCYSLFIINVFPLSVYSAIPATAVAALAFSYSEASAGAKRFGLGVVVICLLNWYVVPVDNSYCVEVGVAVVFGCILGILVALLPLPYLPTAMREVGTRIRIMTASLHCQVAALTLAFTHTGALAAGGRSTESARMDVMRELVLDMADELTAAARTPFAESEQPDVEAPSPASVDGSNPKDASASAPVDALELATGIVGEQPARRADGAAVALGRWASLRFAESIDPNALAIYSEGYGERAPVLRADIEDMHLKARDQLPAIDRAIAELVYEPAVWGRELQVLLSRMWTGAISCCTGVASDASRTHKGGAVARLRTWGSTSAKLHRVVRAIMMAEAEIRASQLHIRFLEFTEPTLCQLVLAICQYHAAAVRYSARLRFHGCRARGCCGLPGRAEHGLACSCMGDRCGYPGEILPSVADLARLRDSVEDALTAFFGGFQQARIQVLYDEQRMTLLAGSGALTEKAVAEGSDERPKPTGWHATELFAVMTFYFTVLRMVQTVMATADATCALSGVADDIPSGATVMSTLTDGVPTARSDALTGRRNQLPASQIGGTASRTRRGTPAIVMTTNYASTPNQAEQIGAAATEPHGAASSPADELKPTCACTCAGCTCACGTGLRRRRCRQVCITAPWRGLIAVRNSLGLRWTQRQAKRAVRVAVGVTVAAMVSDVTRRNFSNVFSFWAPITVAFMSGGSDGGAFRTSVLRMVGTLLGASFGYLVVKVVSGNPVAVGVMLSLWAGAMQYPRSTASTGYWATVSSFTAAIVMVGNGGANVTAQALALTRIEQSWLGIMVYMVVSNVVFPVSARQIVRFRMTAALAALDGAMLSTFRAYTGFVHYETTKRMRDGGVTAHRSRLADAFAKPGALHRDPATPLTSSADAARNLHYDAASLEDPTTSLKTIDALVPGFYELLDEAAAEPDLWRTEFRVLSERYSELSLASQRAARAVRLVYQCLVAMRAQARMFDERRNAAAAQRVRTALEAQPPATGTPAADHATPGTGTIAISIQPWDRGVPAAAFKAGNVHKVDTMAYYDLGSSSSRGILAFSPFMETVQRLLSHAHTVLELSNALIANASEKGAGDWWKRCTGALCRREAEHEPAASVIRQVTTGHGGSLDTMGMLANTVEALLGDLVKYIQEYNDFMHTHVVAVVARNKREEGQYGNTSWPYGLSAAAPGAQSPAVITRGRAGTAINTAAGIQAEIPATLPHGQPRLLLSNLDALCMNTSSFAFHELVEAVADIARIARRAHHAHGHHFR